MKKIRDLLIVLLGIPTVLVYVLYQKTVRISKKKAQRLLDNYLQQNVDSSLKSKEIRYFMHAGNLNFNMIAATVFDPNQVEFVIAFDAKELKKKQILIQDCGETTPLIEQYKNALEKKESQGSVV